jgi:hypothetical protein
MAGTRGKKRRLKDSWSNRGTDSGYVALGDRYGFNNFTGRLRVGDKLFHWSVPVEVNNT